MDETDRKIINELKENSRAAVREIAKKTKLRPSTVHKRIQKLIKERAIEKFTVKLNNKSAEENFIAFVLVKTKPSVILERKIFAVKNIKEVFGITGEYDLLLKAKFKDIEEFNSFLLRLRKEQGIETTSTMIATVDIKEEI
ncbi:MAG TPA: Lrp/AsnC family transcriptional regulator [Candidatus Nanoarchaeia archaeon]|nr:Lrp/AsnC family transcriptional regulator [Candidatus Nanoarchaeia archaeon]